MLRQEPELLGKCRAKGFKYSTSRQLQEENFINVFIMQVHGY